MKLIPKCGGPQLELPLMWRCQGMPSSYRALQAVMWMSSNGKQAGTQRTQEMAKQPEVTCDVTSGGTYTSLVVLGDEGIWHPKMRPLDNRIGVRSTGSDVPGDFRLTAASNVRNTLFLAPIFASVAVAANGAISEVHFFFQPGG